MKRIDVLKLAFKNFGRRKARSVLTILGVIIGTMAVVIMVSIGQGLSQSMMEQFESFGSLNEVTVRKGWDEASQDVYLDDELLEAIRMMPQVDNVLGKKSYSALIINGKEQTWAQLYGVDPESYDALGKDFYQGDGILTGSGNRIVMSYTSLFEFQNPNKDYEWKPPQDEEGNWLPPPFDPFDTTLKLTFDTNYGYGAISSRPKMYTLEVVGISEPGWTNDSWSSFMSIETLEKLYKDYERTLPPDQQGGDGSDGGVMFFSGPAISMSTSGSSGSSSQNKDKYDEIVVHVPDTDDVLDIQNALTEMGYNASSNMEYIEQTQEQMMLIQLVLGGIGAIAFLVAALGIANTMIMSIYERTKEIGIMKVIGCKLGNLRSLFLTEAAIIGFLGGVVGVGLSYAISNAINTLASGGMAMGMGGSTISIIPPWLALAGIAISTFVGIVSGTYPAIRATRLSAIEAIRNE